MAHLRFAASDGRPISAATLELGDFQDAEALSAYEVFELLKTVEADHATDHIPLPPKFGDIKHYADKFGKLDKVDAKKIKDDIVKKFEAHGITVFEVAALMNLMPQDREEAVSVLPSLARLDDAAVEELVAEVSTQLTDGL